MNRIILIGNGFDLAHSLNTRYDDFISDYWAGIYKNFISGLEVIYSDDNIEIRTSSFKKFEQTIQSGEELEKAAIDNKMTLKWRDTTFRVSFGFKNQFLKHIAEKKFSRWVDVEYEYFLCMQKALEGKYLTNE